MLKSVKMVRRILADPCWVGFGGVVDHQIRTTLKHGKSVKRVKRILVK
jgi:hypothetical protein